MKMNIAKLYFYLLTLKEIKTLSWPLKVLWALGPVPSVSNGEISSDSPRLGKWLSLLHCWAQIYTKKWGEAVKTRPVHFIRKPPASTEGSHWLFLPLVMSASRDQPGKREWRQGREKGVENAYRPAEHHSLLGGEVHLPRPPRNQRQSLKDLLTMLWWGKNSWEGLETGFILFFF